MKTGRSRWILMAGVGLAWARAFGLTLLVREDAGVARAGAYVCNGIPVARSLNWTNPAQLRLQTSFGAPVPVQAEVLSRWAGGPESGQPIQWLLLAFPCSPAAHETLTYELLEQAPVPGSNVLAWAETATNIVVDTGVARFSIPRSGFSLFDAVSLADGQGGWRAPVVRGRGQGVVSVPGFPLCTAAPPESLTFEHAGPLRVTVRVSGHFAPAPGAAGRLRYLIRHDFTAGSAGVDTDIHFDLPTDVQGGLGYEGYDTNAYLRLDRVSFALPLALQGAASGFVSAAASAGYPCSLAGGQAVGLTQHLRPAMTSPPCYTLTAAGLTVTGGAATHPLVGAAGSNGGAAASFRLMRRSEPQALSASGSALVLDVVATNQWLGPRQGASCRLRLQFLQPGGDWAAVRDAVAAQLDHPLVAWPPPAEAAASQVFGELWDGRANPAALASFGHLQRICSNTLAYAAGRGMHGFMTDGLVPRYYGHPFYGDEFGDPAAWDGYYFGATFTDYHNVFFNALRLFAMSGDRRLLHELCVPAARRTLSTLIVQGEPEGDYRTGWASIGYGGYRRDNNASHSYFQNLFAYYWLTGDRHVLEVLEQGASVRRFSYNRNPDMTLVPPESAPLADWEGSVDRAGSQRGVIAWFLGHALDAGYLDDFRNQLERLAACHLALLSNAAGQECAFLFESGIRANPQVARLQQPWLSALYPLDLLAAFHREYGDLPLGPDALAPSRILAGFERFVWTIAARVPPGGDGTALGDMANEYDVFWSGPRLGGRYVTNNWTYVDADSLLYVEGKSALLAPLFRAALLATDTSQWQRAWSLENHVLAQPPASTCLDKIMGQYHAGLIPAMSYGAPPVPPSTNMAARRDFDGDQVSDLAVFDARAGAWYAYSLRRQEVLLWAEPWGWPGATAVPGDYDGDGACDLAAYDPVSGSWYAWSAARQAAVVWARRWGGSGLEPVSGDYDGDRTDDLGVWSRADGCWYAWSEVRGRGVLWAWPWGWPGATPVPGDYDGDRVDDLAVYDNLAGAWYAVTTGGVVLAWARPWGPPNAVPVAGDFDGDRASDLAAWNPADATWAIASLKQDAVLAWNQPWGWPGAVPLTGDYDGDGRDDLAVFDPASGAWYIWSMAANTVLAWAQPWGWPGAQPLGPGR